jgi:RNA polymerase sigma-70 factor (sigma-E family)
MRDDEFTEFVTSAYPALVRSAYLLVGDRGQAEDLVQSALYKTYVKWDRVQLPEAYTRTTLLRLAGKAGRRRWRGEIPHAETPADFYEDSSDSLDVRTALAQLPWSQRSVLVLRYFDDLTEAQTAEALGCSLGTVKSRASRGLTALRATGLLTDTEVRDG